MEIAKLVHYSSFSEKNVERILKDKKKFIIGRGKKGKKVDIIIPETNETGLISRVHCAIYKTKKGYSIEDLGSKNNTYLNNRILKPGDRFFLEHQNEIKLGSKYSLRFLMQEISKTQLNKEGKVQIKNTKETLDEDSLGGSGTEFDIKPGLEKLGEKLRKQDKKIGRE